MSTFQLPNGTILARPSNLEPQVSAYLEALAWSASQDAARAEAAAAGIGAGLIDEAEAARDAASSHAANALASRDAAVDARDAAIVARDAAQTARTASESARDGALTARNQANAARDTANSSRDAAALSAGSAQTARTASESARDASVAARTASESARNASVAARDAAIAARTGAESARDTAISTLSSRLEKAANLSDLGSLPIARQNLGLASMALQAANAVAITGGTVEGVERVRVAGGALGGAAGDTLLLGDFGHTNSNATQLRVLAQRLAVGTTWTSTSTRLQARTDTTDQGYIGFNDIIPGTAENSLLAFGGGNTAVAHLTASGLRMVPGAALRFDATSSLGRTVGDADLRLTSGAALRLSGASGVAVDSGMNFGSRTATNPWDYSQHIRLSGTEFGIGVSTGRLNIGTDTGGRVVIYGGTQLRATFDQAGAAMSGPQSVVTREKGDARYLQVGGEITTSISIRNAGPSVTLRDTNARGAALVADADSFVVARTGNDSAVQELLPTVNAHPFVVNLSNGDAQVGRNLGVVGGDITSGAAWLNVRSNLWADSSISGASLASRGDANVAGMLVAGSLSASVLSGGPGNAGRVNLWGNSGSACFRWDGGNFLSRINEASEFFLLRSANVCEVTAQQFGANYSLVFRQSDNGFPVVFVDAFSDARLKRDIRDSEVDALGVLRQVRMRAFEFTEEARKIIPMDDRRAKVRLGFVAQELEPLVPEATPLGPTRMPDGTVEDRYMIKPDELVPYLVRAIQQLEARVAELESEKEQG